jgi:hypothetical protein
VAEQKEKWFRRVRTKIIGALKKLKPKPIMDRSDAIALVGVVSVVRGIALYSHPLAYIAAGVILLAFSYLSATPQKAEQETTQL